MLIRLDRDEVWWGATVGLRRNIESIARKLDHKPPLPNNAFGWMNHVEGALAELVVAKWLGVEWEATVNTFKSGFDVANYQVRWTSKRPGSGQLIIRPDDDSTHVFISVRGTAPKYEILGWLRAADAKRKEYVDNPKNRGEAWFVPQAHLHDLASLPDG